MRSLLVVEQQIKTLILLLRDSNILTNLKLSSSEFQQVSLTRLRWSVISQSWIILVSLVHLAQNHWNNSISTSMSNTISKLLHPTIMTFSISSPWLVSCKLSSSSFWEWVLVTILLLFSIILRGLLKLVIRLSTSQLISMLHQSIKLKINLLLIRANLLVKVKNNRFQCWEASMKLLSICHRNGQNQSMRWNLRC